jgi:poly(A) polymerase
VYKEIFGRDPVAGREVDLAKSANRSTALYVLRRLREAGFTALFAGGCVRDMLLGVACEDYDIATDARPEQVRDLFRRVLLVGAQFGVAVVVHRGRHVEVATFRTDLSYSDGRHPDEIRFSSPREDALRRDFTINGMFYDPLAEEVVDYVGGRADLAEQMVRTIGRPQDRFAEDALRMLRAPRFAARFAFEIEGRTADAIRHEAANLESVSGERILDELRKMLSRDSAERALRLCERLRLAEVILPELLPSEGPEPAGSTLWERGLQRVGLLAAREDEVLSLGGLLCDLDERTIRRILRRWGGSNALRDAVCGFSAQRDDWREAAEEPLHAFKRRMAWRQFERLLTLWEVRERLETGRQRQSDRIRSRAKGIDPGAVRPEPLVYGHDLMNLGVEAGPRLGELLRELYDAQLDERVNDRRSALQLARRLAAEPGR